MAAQGDEKQRNAAAWALFDSDDEKEEEKQSEGGAPVRETHAVAPDAPVDWSAANRASASGQDDDVKILQGSTDLWPDQPMLYLGPICLATGIDTHGGESGGGRGYTAAQDIMPGTILCVEKCFVEWPEPSEDYPLLINMVRKILKREDALDVVRTLGPLHPKTLESCDAELLARVSEERAEEIAKISADFPGVISKDEILRLILALQSNAFGSGAFLHFSMFNHSCKPNCLKLTAATSSGGSELCATTFIKKGEPLTISYLLPLEQSMSTRQTGLRKQFGFECACVLCSSEPPASNATLLWETKVAEAEGQVAAGENPDEILPLLLAAITGLETEDRGKRMVLARAHRLVTECAEHLLNATGEEEFAVRFLRSSIALLDLQRWMLWPEHADLARSLLDVSEGVRTLLGIRNGRLLLHEFAQFSDLTDAREFMAACRKEHLKIKRCYDQGIARYWRHRKSLQST